MNGVNIAWGTLRSWDMAEGGDQTVAGNEKLSDRTGRNPRTERGRQDLGVDRGGRLLDSRTQLKTEEVAKLINGRYR